MLTQDWMMRQIETLTLAIAKIIFQKDDPEYRSGVEESDRLHAALNALVKENRLDEAEDLLFEALDPAVSAYLDVANDFYYRLNLLSDRELAAGNFSRQELQEGLEDVMDQFGVVLP